MTHYEVRAAIERLQSLVLDGDFNKNLSLICATLYQPQWGWNSGACAMLRDTLVELLVQADPDTHIKLPVDADGVPICIGDKLDFTKAESDLVVLGVGLSDPLEDGYGVYVLNGYGSYTWYNAEYLHHHPKPTVEDVLLELVDVAIGDIASKSRSENMTYGDWAKSNEIIAEYAERIRKMVEEES